MGSTASYINRTFAVLRSFPSNPFADACFSIKPHKNLRSENVLLLLRRRLMDDGWWNLIRGQLHRYRNRYHQQIYY